jgi:hypothetical protein
MCKIVVWCAAQNETANETAGKPKDGKHKLAQAHRRWATGGNNGRGKRLSDSRGDNMYAGSRQGGASPLGAWRA